VVGCDSVTKFQRGIDRLDLEETTGKDFKAESAFHEMPSDVKSLGASSVLPLPVAE